MATRSHGYEISRPHPILDPAQAKVIDHRLPHQAAPSISELPPSNPAWPLPGLRPLSDIREITEPSLMDMTVRQQNAQLATRRSTSRVRSVGRQPSVKREGMAKPSDNPAFRTNATSNPYEARTPSASSTSPEQSVRNIIPQSSVPRRSSSFGQSQPQDRGHARQPSMHDVRQLLRPAPSATALTIPNRGRSDSPVKVAGLHLDSVTSEVVRSLPSRTHIRVPHPIDLLESPTFRHPRIKLELQVSGPIFVGGGTLEGFVRITVDENERLKPRRTLGVGSLSVDLLGYEASGNRRATFVALGTELIDSKHGPPPNTVEPANPLMPSDKFWTLLPSASSLPFLISLPIDTGPAPFQSKHASIGFQLSTTAVIRDAGTHYRVRTSQEVQVLPTHDPEKTLASLPSPLMTADTLTWQRAGRCETVKATAGLHRQVWVSGSSIFVDVFVANRSTKHIRRIDLNLERDVLCYKHAAAATREKSALRARVSDKPHQTMIATTSLQASTSGWHGLDPHSMETRTYNLDIPRGHATVKPGKFFEVCFFLNISIVISSSKTLTLQLPIKLVHMNSLDVVPNFVAQVAAAFEQQQAHTQRRQRSNDLRSCNADHRRHRPISSPAHDKDLRRQRSYTQGRAFAAPRQQSVDRHRAHQADIEVLRHVLDTSPRKHTAQLQGFTLKKAGSNFSFGNVSAGGRSTDHSSPFRAVSFHPPSPKYTLPDVHDGAAEGVGSIRARMRKMASFSTLQSERSQTRIGMKPPSRPSTAASSRERKGRGRFESRAVATKRSDSAVGRGGSWWLRMRHKLEDREGWI
ncbi:hypothetical protein BAUCODRAFT_62253 [Baudoinia panamericana UAMH 10762]|uniref:Arrestin C-terminal-like domain-containing protein n=1 Tax=Baudoinia panamericana (strain UAMH 10762) TaxID=717646 RepID=M2NQ41_BAUPA|nr:uncharacterized protein BAUCODRAFT_62253 [Baudoinia panamericana UAMH 10762]EMD01136.1 hypothetical protein BAUCODRAFT_62253 [Baudoinia panamericana UAMH 10762]